MHTLAAEQHLRRLYPAVCRAVVEDFGFSRTLLATVDRRRHILCARAGFDPSIGLPVYSALRELYRVSLHPDAGGRYAVAAWCVTRQEQVHVRDAVHYDFRPAETKQLTLLVRALGAREYCLTPIVFQGQSLGMLGVDKKGQDEPITVDERELLGAVCEMVGMRLGPLLIRSTTVVPPDPTREPAGTSGGAGGSARSSALPPPVLGAPVLDALDEGVLVIGSDGQARYANPAALALLEASSCEMSGQRLEKALSVPGVGDLAPLLAGGTALDPTATYRATLRRRSGSEVEVTVRLAPVDWMGTACTGVLVTDLGEQAEAGRTRDSFVVMLAHDLKAPLQSMIGFAELLRMGRLGPVNTEQGDFLRRIEENGELMLRLVGKIIDVEQFKSGATLLRRQRLRLCPLVDGVLTRLAGQAVRAGVRLENECRLDGAQVWADRDRVIEVFQNLVTNAIEASHEGGVVTVWGKVRSRGRAGVAEFEVITEAVRLGDGSSARRPVHPGVWGRTAAAVHGLGLSIARLIVQRHGGEIWVEDRWEGGVAVGFTLPLDNGEEPAVLA